MIPHHIHQDLKELQSVGQYRELKIYEKGTDFFSNDYLGLASLTKNNLQNDWVGATGSRLISGNHQAHQNLENFIEKWFSNSALLFGSGYMANLGVLSALPTRHDTILYDSLCHASIKDGIRLSLAKSYSFPHNNYEKLEKLIQNSKGDVYVVVESVYSMDGDSPDAKILKEFVTKYGIYLIVDEAHSFGICGEDGRGWSYENDLLNDNLVTIFPLGKAAGAYGAFVIANKTIIHYLINSARTFIYSTALPPILVSIIYDNLILLKNANEQRKQIKELASFFKNSWIYPFILPGNELCKNFAKKLIQKGFLVKAILSPTVPKGKERIRIVLHSFNTVSEVNQLKATLENLSRNIKNL
jgi:8-amino-7-oxononanoate synthase